MNGKKSLRWLLPACLIVAAVLLILEQTVRYGVVWDWGQVLHHENFALMLISLALGILLSPKVTNKNRKKQRPKDENEGKSK